MSNFPKKMDSKDIMHLVGKAAISVVPVLGGPASELFAAAITPSLEKRRIEWLDSLAEKIMLLQQEIEDFSYENLAKNDIFISSVLQASQVAIRTHKKEKLNSLRNAVLNSVQPKAIDEDQQDIFIGYIDTLTSWHLKVLKFFENPRVWGKKQKIVYRAYSTGSPATVLEDTFPYLKNRRDFYDQIVKDLYSRGLMSVDNLHIAMTAQGMFESKTTHLGKKFIEFITLDLEE